VTPSESNVYKIDRTLIVTTPTESNRVQLTINSFFCGDGKYEGKPVPDGVYTYVVRLVYGNEDVNMLTGFITVLR
jgi:hypothetical protein